MSQRSFSISCRAKAKGFTDPAEYSSAIAAQIGGVRQYFQLTGGNVVGVQAESGPGTLALVEATPERYAETGRFDPTDRSQEPSWPHPVIAGGRLYLRDQDVLLSYKASAN